MTLSRLGPTQEASNGSIVTAFAEEPGVLSEFTPDYWLNHPIHAHSLSMLTILPCVTCRRVKCEFAFEAGFTSASRSPGPLWRHAWICGTPHAVRARFIGRLLPSA